MTRRMIGWIVVATIIIIIILTCLFIGYFSRRPNKFSLYDDPDFMLYSPQRYWHHPEYDMEIRTIYGKITDDEFILARMLRHRDNVNISEYMINTTANSIYPYKFRTKLSQPFPNDTANISSKFLNIDYRFNEETHLDDWDVKTDRWNIFLRPNRFPCIMGEKGFLSFDQDYTMAGYVIMDNNTTMFQSNKSSEILYPELRLSHDWGQIESEKYIHQRYHIFLEDTSAAEIYVVDRDNIQYTNICIEQPIGKKINFPVEIINKYLITSHKVPNFRMELKAMSYDITHKIGVCSVKMFYGDENITGWCIYESYDL